MPTYTPDYRVPVTFSWTDPEGKRGTTKSTLHVSDFTLVTPDDLTAAATVLGTALVATTHAHLTHISIGIEVGVDYTLPTETGTFDSIEDKARLEWVDATGHPIIMKVPSPLAAIFVAGDDETVNPANLDVAGILTALNTHSSGTASAGGGDIIWVSGANGVPTVYISGTRLRGKSRRKFRPGIATELGGN